MANKVVCCPYCVVGSEFRSMFVSSGRLVHLPEVWPHSKTKRSGFQVLLSEVWGIEAGGIIAPS